MNIRLILLVSFGCFLLADVNAQSVGVNTDGSAPTELLHVKSAAAAEDGILIENANASGDPILQWRQNGTTQFTLGVDASDNDKLKLGTTSIATNTRITIDAAGDVGFGEGATDPQELIHLRSLDSDIRMESISDVATLRFQKAEGTLAVPTIVADDDVIGQIEFEAYDGSGYETGAAIRAEIDGTPSNGTDMPTRLIFQTVPDGSVTRFNRIVIKENGYVGIGTDNPASILDVTGTGGENAFARLFQYSSNTTPSLLGLYKARGTESAPTTVTTNDFTGFFDTYGYDGSSWVNNFTLYSVVDAAPSGGRIKSSFIIASDNGSSLQTRLYVSGDGDTHFNGAIGVVGTDYTFLPSPGTGIGKVRSDFVSFGSNETSGSELFLAYGRGNTSTPAVVQNGDLLGQLVFGGFVNSSTLSTSSYISSVATETFSATNTGSDIRFFTSANSNGGTSEVLRLNNDGVIGFGTGGYGVSEVGDFHFIGGNDVSGTTSMTLAPNIATSEGSSVLYLAEDADKTYGMAVLYDGSANQIQFEGYSNGTNYTDLVTIDRNTGNVNIAGSIAKGSGSFRIDHPLDPENKFLYHSFVESPDMMNVYNGNVNTNNDGIAVVELPDYFESLNSDFRYQLTVIGSFAQAMILSEINNNTFKIKTSEPNVKVSWQITGIRKDPYANENRIPNTVEKEDWQKGYYLHPSEYNQPLTKGLGMAKRPVINETGETLVKIKKKTAPSNLGKLTNNRLIKKNIKTSK